MNAKHMRREPARTGSGVGRRVAALAATAAIVAGTVLPTAALAREAVAAGLGDVDPSQQASSDRSASVAKSGAQALLESLGVAPTGKTWSWVTDSPATTRTVDVWRTSDGQEFDSEAEAQAYASSHALTVAKGTRDVPTWTVDGTAYDSEGAANAAADAKRPTVIKTTRAESYWKTSDGQEFASEDEARDHCAQASVTYAAGTRDVPTWTVDGTAYDSEDAANAAADAKRPQVTSTTSSVDVWRTSDGQEFDSQEAANAHVSSSAEWDDTVTAEMAVFSDGHIAMTAEDTSEYMKQQAAAGNNVSYSVKNVTNTFHNSKPWAQSIETWMTYVATLDGTTPLQTFGSMEEAQAWCEARQHKVTSSQQAVTTWKTSDGQEFASEAEAQDHCAEVALVDPVTTSVIRYYASMDGAEHAFDTAEERDAWADANGPSVQKLSRTVTDWDTTATDYFGAQSFSDEEAAKAYVASHTWKVQAREYYRCPEDDEVFYTEEEAGDHFEETGHGYMKVYAYIAYCSQASGKSRSFDDEDEANAYAASQTPTYHSVQRDVAYWRTSDGLEFSFEADANYHLSQMDAPRRYEATHDVVSWKTSDGQTFDSQADAENHAEEITPSYSSSTSTRTVWGTDADDQTFPTEQEAYKHAASVSPYAIGQRKQRVVWKTSDGQTFDDEASAKAHGQTLCLTVSKGSRDVVTWHCAGSDYATEAEANAAADALRPQVVEGTRQVACWKSSDGQEFDTEAEAHAYAASHQVTATAATRDVDVWTVAGSVYGTEQSANAAADALRPQVAAGTRQVDVWRTSDGQEFDTEAKARDHAASTPISYERGEREEAVEEWGHWELADLPATDDGKGGDGAVQPAPAGSEGDDPAPSGDATPATDAGATATDDGSLPVTGDASALPMAASAAMGAGAVLASLRARRRRSM